MPAHAWVKVFCHESLRRTPPSKSSLLLAVSVHVPMSSWGRLQYGFPDSIDATPAFRYAKLLAWLFHCHS